METGFAIKVLWTRPRTATCSMVWSATRPFRRPIYCLTASDGLAIRPLKNGL